MPTRKKKQRPSSRGASTRAAPAAPPMMDRRLMERHLGTITRLLEEQDFATHEEADTFLQDLLARGGGKLPDLRPRTPLEEAQELIYQALEAKGRRRRDLAQKALEISPDCADAYVLLAEGTKDAEAALGLYEQGVQAGERAIGPELFAETEAADMFWDVLETRPYMRARSGVADVLWFLGRREEAIGHQQELLRLNPNDNQGIRYELVSRLLVVGDDAAARQLLDRYRDDASASWAYARALLLFRRHGEGRRANRALAEALEANPFVPVYLLGLEEPPRHLPDLIELGGESEAIEYLMEGAESWLETPGALEWLVPVVTTALEGVLSSELPDLLDATSLPPGLPEPPNLFKLPRR